MKHFILAYAYGKSLLTVTPDDAKRLTHVNIAFGLVGQDGLLDTSELPYMNYVEKIRSWNPELKFVLSIGGWEAGNFSTMAMTAEGRERFAASCADFVKQWKLDGIDIDWEYPCDNSAGIDCDPSDREHYTALLQALRDALGADKIVSIAAGAGEYFIEDTEMEKVAEICNYVQLMTYDMRSGFCTQAGHHTSLYATAGDETTRNAKDISELFHAAGVPYEKMILGAAFYARVWHGVPDVNCGMLQEAESVGLIEAQYTDVVTDYLGRNGFTAYWDEQAQAPYLFNGSAFMSYDDERSITAKCGFLKDKGMLGIMYWEHGGDATHTLLKCMADNL